MSDRLICLSLGHLGGLDAGLGEFARRLGEGLVHHAGELRRNGFRLAFHLRPHLHGAFGSDVDYVTYRSRQRWLPWKLPGCVLWHSAFQHNATRPPLSTAHRLLTVHDLNYRYVSGLGALRDGAVCRLAMARSTGLATISRYVAADIGRNTGWRGPLRTIYNGAADLFGAPQEPVAPLVGSRFFFHLSRMAPSKNVNAIVDLARAWPERTFVLAGPAWGDSKTLHDELQGRMQNLHVLLGVSEAQKAWLLAHCEAFLFPSLTEGFGLPPIEAMNFGRPVFLSDRTCLPEIGGDWAGYFSDFSPAAMRQVVEEHLPALLRRGAEIRAHARSFDWDRCVAGYLGWYGELLGFDARVVAPPPGRLVTSASFHSC